MSNVKHGDQMFYLGDSESKPDAMMTYVSNGDDKIVIDHTEVSEELQGQGKGKELVEAAVQYARDNNKKIVPVCTYAKKVLEENKDYQDVLAAE
ncbi:N-acetyltransferase [Macrococcus hajekii]|uniref:N-acetyltransferase n=1 Tax=Macrococcus hajekii TaxID=198482 RepID=A0A4R6BJ63_9STAP|nr:GNAT family N-acetyltransferase [Macrococcus hajekii]TDM01733.1 N-acetyltransferase [Macrococcus hajekii]GGB06932.1 N-acetyltransferase [Macrococcus hajekii]